MTKTRTLLTMLLTALALLTAPPHASAQERKLQNRPYIDLRTFHYGFFFGVHNESLRMPNNGYIDPDTGNQWFASNDRFDPGFSVGLVGEWRLNANFALRLTPTMHFGNKHITFRNQIDGAREYQDVKSTYVAMPLLVKFTPPRINNYRPYFVAGINPMLDLTRKDQANIELKAYNTLFEIGFGLDRYLPYFKFIPELKFCFGLNDVLKTNRKDLRDPTKQVFTKSVSSAHTNLIVLSLYFE